MSEKIVTFWRLGYFKLFDENGNPSLEPWAYVDGDDWKQLVWRFYFKTYDSRSLK